MAKLSFDDGDGVWRTIGGRRVFIRSGQSLSSAMKESGKFKSAKKKSTTKDENKKFSNDELNEKYAERKKQMENWLNETNSGKLGKDEEEALKYEREKHGEKAYQDLKKEFEKGDDTFKKASASESNDKEDKKEQKSIEDNKSPGQKTADLIKESGVKTFADEIKESSTKESNYRNKITDVAKNSKEDNVTLDVETGKPVSFEKGYSVSFQQSSDNYSDEEYHAKVEECKAKCDGKVYAGKYGGDAEASFHTDSLEDAKELMYKYNQESIYDWKHETLIMNDKYNASTNKTNYKEEKTTNDYMNKKIRNSVSKNKDDLPKKVKIETQGTSNRKEVSENIQAHILDYYDKPEDFIQQMDNMNEPTMWHAGEKLAKGGSYMIYYDEQRDFLNSLKINPKNKEFSDDRVFQTYTSLVGRESAKLYDRLQKNAYRKYLKEHPLSKLTFQDFKDMRKGGK